MLCSLLLPIMNTSLYFWSFQRVWNANGLRNTFTYLLPRVRKSSWSLGSLLGSSESYLLTWVGLLKHVTSRKATKSRSLVCFSTVRPTLAADLTWPHWETTAAYEIRTIETEHEQYVARCSPSLSLLQQRGGLGPPWFGLFHMPDIPVTRCLSASSPFSSL